MGAEQQREFIKKKDKTLLISGYKKRITPISSNEQQLNRINASTAFCIRICDEITSLFYIDFILNDCILFVFFSRQIYLIFHLLESNQFDLDYQRILTRMRIK